MIAFLLASYGLFFVVAQSKIFADTRNAIRIRSRFLDDMLECAFCTGFWASLLVAAYLFGMTLKLPVYALAGATTCLFMDAVLNVLESWVIKE